MLLLLVCLFLTTAVMVEPTNTINGFQQCSLQDIDILQKQVYALWSSANPASIKLALGQEYSRRLYHHSEETRRFRDMLFRYPESHPVTKVTIIRLVDVISSYLSLLHREDVLVEYLRHLMTQFSFVPGMTPNLMKVLFDFYQDLMPEAISCLDQVAWNSCFKHIANLAVQELSDVLQRQQGK